MTVIQMKMGVIRDTLCPVLQVLLGYSVNTTVIHTKNYTGNTGSTPYFRELYYKEYLCLFGFSNNISLIKREYKDKKDYKELNLRLKEMNEVNFFYRRCNTRELVIYCIAFGDACGDLGTK